MNNIWKIEYQLNVIIHEKKNGENVKLKTK